MKDVNKVNVAYEAEEPWLPIETKLVAGSVPVLLGGKCSPSTIWRGLGGGL